MELIVRRLPTSDQVGNNNMIFITENHCKCRFQNSIRFVQKSDHPMNFHGSALVQNFYSNILSCYCKGTITDKLRQILPNTEIIV